MRKKIIVVIVLAAATITVIYSFFIPSPKPKPTETSLAYQPPKKKDIYKVGYDLGRKNGEGNALKELYGKEFPTPQELQNFAEQIRGITQLYNSDLRYDLDLQKVDFINGFCKGYGDGYHHTRGRAF